MIGFLKSRSLKNAAAREAAAATPTSAVDQAQPIGRDGGEPAGEKKATSETTLASPPVVPSTRYEVREDADGWSVHDRQTGTTAETHGYRLTRMSRSRAESLVDVLNRGEARKRGRNG